jgi:hypothetical protein
MKTIVTNTQIPAAFAAFIPFVLSSITMQLSLAL